MIVKILREFSLFFNVKEEVLYEIVEFSKVVEYKSGEIVFLEDENIEFLYCVVKGNLITYSVDVKGDIIPKGNFYEGDVLGLISNIQNEKAFLNAKALSDSVVLKIEFDKFQSYISYPPFSDRIIKQLTNILKIQTKLSKLEELESLQKFVYVLLNFPTRFVRKKKYLLAKELGMTPETLSRVIRKLKDDKLIEESNGNITILDRDKLLGLM